MQITTKIVKKEDRLGMKTETGCAKGVFQNQLPIYDVNISNNKSIPQARVNMNETEKDTTLEIS